MALLFSLTPGLSEVAEAAVHLLAHGDLPHHDADAEGDLEHSCTPLGHHCGCHASMSAQLSRSMTTSLFSDVTRIQPGYAAGVRGRSCEPPPLRPPIG